MNLPRSRFLVIADSHLGLLEQVAGELTDLERVVVHAAGPGRAPTPLSLPWERLDGCSPPRAPTGDPAWRCPERRRPGHVHLGTTGRSKGAIKQHAWDYFWDGPTTRSAA